MASLYGHAIAGISVGNIFRIPMSRKMIVLLIVSSVIPDIDVISFYGGIPDQSMWGHRGFTHSILFALLWAVLMAFLFFK